MKQWTETNGIPEKQYYYWQRRVRTEIYGLIQKKLPCTKPADELSFAEFPMQESNVSASFRADAVVRTGNMLTEPSEKLCISCSGMDAEGKALRVSGIVNRVKKLFENFPEDNAAAEDDEEIYSAVQAERALIRALADGRDRNAGTERLKGLLRLRLKSSSVLQEKSAQLLQAASADYCDTGIGSGTAALLYGSELSGSVTRLEDFAQCPYAHFLKYGLGLGERKVYEIAPSDIGTLSHEHPPFEGTGVSGLHSFRAP